MCVIHITRTVSFAIFTGRTRALIPIRIDRSIGIFAGAGAFASRRFASLRGASRRFAALRGASRRFAALCRSVTQQLPTCVACWRCTGESVLPSALWTRVKKRGATQTVLRELALGEVGILATRTFACTCKRMHGAQSCPERIGLSALTLRAIRAEVFALKIGDGSRLRFVAKDLRVSMTPLPSVPVRLYSSQRASTFHYKIAGDFVCASTYIEVMCISEHTLQNARTLASHRNINLR